MEAAISNKSDLRAVAVPSPGSGRYSDQIRWEEPTIYNHAEQVKCLSYLAVAFLSPGSEYETIPA